jgi:glycerol-3-phosphate dehydrogenase
VVSQPAYDISRVETVDVAVIGGGVVGLATARALASPNVTVCLLERHPRLGMETSSHNSGVIHAGIYYPAGSLKARLCVDGLRRLYEYCEARRVPHARIGKLVLAEPSQRSTLAILLNRGRENGAIGLQLVDEDFVKRREPHVRPLPGIYSPSTGIIEAEALVRALAADCADREVMVLPGAALRAATKRDGGYELVTSHETFHARVVVNAAGLFADDVSKMLGGEIFRIFPVRGEYAVLTRSKSALVQALVYPLPPASGHSIGTHLTKTMAGDVLIGPTARYQSGKDDYEHDRLPVSAFLDEARHLLPGITADDLRLAGSGIRAKLHPPEESFADFMIRRDSHQTNLIQVAGIDSPGLTSCLAIGEMAAGLAREAL